MQVVDVLQANLQPNLDLYLHPNFFQMFMNKKSFLKFNAI
jgi:hypothetical protein